MTAEQAIARIRGCDGTAEERREQGNIVTHERVDQYRAFQGANGWYVAQEDSRGFHRQPSHGSTLTEQEARKLARQRNASRDAEVA